MSRITPSSEAPITASERIALAAKLGMSEQYLYQCLTGRKAMSPLEAVKVEVASDRAVRRWHLRPDDWHLIWPELIGTEGAPLPFQSGGSDSAGKATGAGAGEPAALFLS
ncbi:MAG TPA: YdaS family helix-turn-helix protein [Steroidobacteraceae bacterium]|nr:YdaS family helix-turn-helix protein [Steroidobacteraceae bacterium]